MPTVTSLNWLTLTNLGPLTTTYTPAPSCTALATQPDAGYLFLGYRPDDLYQQPYGPVECTPQDFKQCLPSGEVRQSILVHGNEFTQPYYSPGYHCPSGWTAAITARASAVSASAIGADSTRTGTQTLQGSGVLIDAFVVTALAPTETMTVCCPSGYDPYVLDLFYQGGCTSTLAAPVDRVVSSWCSDRRPTTELEVTVLGADGPKWLPVSDAPPAQTRVPLTQTTTDTDGLEVHMFHTVPNIVLINAGEATATPTGTNTGNKAGDGTEENAANAQRPSMLAVAALCSLVTAAWGLCL